MKKTGSTATTGHQRPPPLQDTQPLSSHRLLLYGLDAGALVDERHVPYSTRLRQMKCA